MSHCYAKVVSTCNDGHTSYSVQATLGYLISELVVYPAAGQALADSALASPTGWTGKRCSSGGIDWSVPSSGAVAAVSGFQADFDLCASSQLLAVHVVPVSALHPYLPPGVSGSANTFFAQAGCLINVQSATWGRIKNLYR